MRHFLFDSTDDDHFHRTPVDTEITPEDRGRIDAKRGYALTECPYQDKWSIERWQKGWRRVHVKLATPPTELLSTRRWRW